MEELQLPVRLTGLDLKEDVVAFCSEMAKKLGYKHLEFVCADIRDFAAEGQVDLVVSLHACDVATDFALAQAVRWGARVILAVPCCQHEIFTQLQKGTQSVPVSYTHLDVYKRQAEYQLGIYVLYRFVEGTPGDKLGGYTAAFAREAGATLARLHRVLAEYPAGDSFPVFDLFQEAASYAWPAVQSHAALKFGHSLHPLKEMCIRDSAQPAQAF